MRQVSELFDFKSKPSSQFMIYSALFFVIGNFLSLIGSVAVVVASYLASRFFGVAVGITFVSGLGLLIGILKWHGTIREFQRKLSEKFPKYASLILSSDEVWFMLGLAAAVAGLFVTLVLPFGFLLLLAGLCLLEQRFLAVLKSLEGKEQGFFSEEGVQLSQCFSKDYDASYLVYSLITLYANGFLKMEENLGALECYLKIRQEILGR